LEATGGVDLAHDDNVLRIRSRQSAFSWTLWVRIFELCFSKGPTNNVRSYIRNSQRVSYYSSSLPVVATARHQIFSHVRINSYNRGSSPLTGASRNVLTPPINNLAAGWQDQSSPNVAHVCTVV
jgi:hypothetical protein